nr:hypothetical protein GTC16762_32560 [Pigmentibacter ruber]
MAVNGKYKVYGSLEQFLRRKKIESASKLAHFLLNAFVEAPLEKRDGEFVLLYRHDFERAGLISEGQSFDSLREKLILKGVLVWKVKPNDPNFIYKKNYFAPSSGVLNYINRERLSRSTVATVEDITKLDVKINDKADVERVSKLEEKVKQLEGNMENMAAVILTVLPPDNPERRAVIDKFKNRPHQEIIEQLALQAKEVEKNIQKTGRMFN